MLRRNFKEYTKEIRMQKYLKKKMLPPHSIPCNNFSGRIYVKKTPKQCCFNHYSSQKAKEDTWWDRYSSKGWNSWQVCDQDGLKGDYIKKKESPREGIEENLREKREKKNYCSINPHTQRIQQQSTSSDNDLLKIWYPF